MFTIEKLWGNSKLAPLKKAHEANQMDRRLVVVINGASDVNIQETEALHEWLEQQQYQRIPSEWETSDLDILQVVHISQLTVTVLRRNPFSATPQPLTPNSWLNKLNSNEFDAILLAQSMGEIANVPTQREIKDSIKPGIEQPTAFWAEMISNVEFCKSGQAPKNAKQKQMLAHWRNAESRRHYDPTSQTIAAETPNPQSVVIEREYIWFGPGENKFGWNQRLTQLRDWISSRVHSSESLRNIAQQVLGTSASIIITGGVFDDAHALVREARNNGKLDDLANLFDFVQPITTTAAPSAFNQSGQQVYGRQVNINTGGGALINGSVFNTGDLVGRDKIVVQNITNSRGVAIGGNVRQTVIITGDNNNIA